VISELQSVQRYVDFAGGATTVCRPAEEPDGLPPKAVEKPAYGNLRSLVPVRSSANRT
jgi:hypothetical protein